MTELGRSIQQAMAYMPQAREKHARSRALTLDTLLSEGRQLQNISGNTLDLVLMAYRYGHLFRTQLVQFSRKALKPRELEDLLQIVFGAILSRDNTPTAALVNDGVELAKSKFGKHTAPVVNAFLRRISAQRDPLREALQKSPDPLLGDALLARWKDQPALVKQAGKQILRRPASGIHSFDSNGEFKLRAAEEFLKSPLPLQAMDPGSWAWMQFLHQKAQAHFQDRPIRVLDACAAPGGKLIAMSVLFAPETQLSATDISHPRLEKVKENLLRWKKSDIPLELKDWSSAASDSKKYDLILADLPCSGSGTLASRPDVLFEPLEDRIQELMPIQKKILDNLKARLTKGGMLAVSLCSVDPQEIQSINATLESTPVFESWKQSDIDTLEGITGWLVTL